MDLDIPKGIVYRFQHLKAKPHQFGVRDPALAKYCWEAFSDRAKGLAWAKGHKRAMDRGEATALRPLLTELGPLYIDRLRTQGSNDAYVDQVQEVIDQLTVLGANDINADGFSDRVQRWLNGMKSHRIKSGVLKPAAPRTKRRRLTIARAICHFAMKLPGRPVRFDPLSDGVGAAGKAYGQASDPVGYAMAEIQKDSDRKAAVFDLVSKSAGVFAEACRNAMGRLGMGEGSFRQQADAERDANVAGLSGN